MSSFSPQQTQLLYLQGSAGAGATANGNGTSEYVGGFLGAQQVEIVESGGGTATIALQGSMDGVTWYSMGYQQIDGQATLSRSVSAIAVAANSAHVYQLLDPYRQLRAVLSAVAGAAVTARAYLVPA